MTGRDLAGRLLLASEDNAKAARAIGDEFEAEQKAKAGGDAWRCRCGLWVAVADRYNLNGKAFACRPDCCERTEEIKASLAAQDAKPRPVSPPSRIQAREFVEQFKDGCGYDLAQEFEDDLAQSLETFFDNMEHCPGCHFDDRGQSMAWRT